MSTWPNDFTCLYVYTFLIACCTSLEESSERCIVPTLSPRLRYDIPAAWPRLDRGVPYPGCSARREGMSELHTNHSRCALGCIPLSAICGCETASSRWSMVDVRERTMLPVRLRRVPSACARDCMCSCLRSGVRWRPGSHTLGDVPTATTLFLLPTTQADECTRSATLLETSAGNARAT